MTTTARIDWSDVAAAAKELAGNWQRFECFVWYRGRQLDAAADWMIWYTSHRDAGVLSQSNDAAIRKWLKPFSVGDDPDLVFEQHSSWIVGHVDGFSLLVLDPDGTITAAFREFCRLNERLDDYPILDEQDYGDREYAATLENYACEMWRSRGELPDGWASKVYDWFRDHDLDCHSENRDDQGGWAPREAITEALTDLGLLPRIVGVKVAAIRHEPGRYGSRGSTKVEGRTMYFAVIGTRRVDLGESVVALLSTEALAWEIGRRLVAQRPWMIRCRVRQVFLTFNQTAEIVERWGREDAARGQPVEYADRIMAPYQEVYLAGYRAGSAGDDR